MASWSGVGSTEATRKLLHEHSEKHFTAGEVVRDVIIGVSDGLTVPFALAAGLSGANVPSSLILIAGLSEVAAGAISMGLGGYLAAKSEADHYMMELKREQDEIISVPDTEAAEVGELLSEYGLEPHEYAPVVNALRKNPQAWLDFMMKIQWTLITLQNQCLVCKESYGRISLEEALVSGRRGLRKTRCLEMAGVAGKKTDKSEPVRKSRRVPKRRVLDEQFDDGVNDEEIRYLEKLRSLKVTSDCDFNYADGEDKHQRKVLRDGKKSRSERQSENKDLVEEELISDVLQKDYIYSSVGAKKEMSLTRRQRALQSGKDASTSLIEFPNGLPPAPPTKHKEKLTEVEQQLKKAAATQRRRVQVAKAAKESELGR